jgi:hypothetical protein
MLVYNNICFTLKMEIADLTEMTSIQTNETCPVNINIPPIKIATLSVNI